MSWLWNDPVGFLLLALGIAFGFWFAMWLGVRIPSLVYRYRWTRRFNKMKRQTQKDLYGNLGPEVTKLAPQIAKLTSGWKHDV